jgi:hypothetical protein
MAGGQVPSTLTTARIANPSPCSKRTERAQWPQGLCVPPQARQQAKTVEQHDSDHCQEQLARLAYVDVKMAPPWLSSVCMLLSFEFNGHSNEPSVTYAALGDNMPSEVPDVEHRTL